MRKLLSLFSIAVPLVLNSQPAMMQLDNIPGDKEVSVTNWVPVVNSVVGDVLAIGNRTNVWNTAYGWGDHASAGYVKQETDPVALPRIQAVEQRTNLWNTAYSYGPHVGLYLGLPDWQTWLSTNALASTEYVDLAISSIPPPLTDRIITPDGSQWIDATGTVWRVQQQEVTNWWFTHYLFDTDYRLDLPYPLPPTFRFEINQFDDVRVIYSCWTEEPYDRYTSIITLQYRGNYTLDDGYGEHWQFVSETWWTTDLWNRNEVIGDNQEVIAILEPRASLQTAPQAADRLALASELGVGDYVPLQGGTATNLTLAGWVSMPQSQPTNLVLRLTASNEFILVEEVFK